MNNQQNSTFLNENKEIIVTGPGPENQSGTVSMTQKWNNIEEKSKNNDNDEAAALLDLRTRLNIIKEKADEINKLIETYKSNLSEVKAIMIGVVIVTVIAFLIGFYQISLDKIGEKELYLKYDDLWQSYSDKNIELKEVVNKQNIEIINLKNQIDLLKAKNSYLK